VSTLAPPRRALAVALALALVPTSVRAQDLFGSAAVKRVPLDVAAVRRKNADTLKRLAASDRGYAIELGDPAGEPGAVLPPVAVRVTLPPVDDANGRRLLDRARSLLASKDARQRNLVVEIRKEFFRGAEESSERHRAWAEFLLENESGRRIGINELAEAIVFDSRNAAAWASLARALPAEGKKLVDRSLTIRAALREDGPRTAIVLDPKATGRAATAAWLAYARTRALWRVGGEFEERFGAGEPYRPTAAEMIDAVERLAETYEAERASDPSPPDPALAWLAELRGESLLRAFVHVDVAPGPLEESRRAGLAPDAESVREYLGRCRVDPPSRAR